MFSEFFLDLAEIQVMLTGEYVVLPRLERAIRFIFPNNYYCAPDILPPRHIDTLYLKTINLTIIEHVSE